MNLFLSLAVGASEGGLLVQDGRKKWKGEWDDNMRHCQVITTNRPQTGLPVQQLACKQ